MKHDKINIRKGMTAEVKHIKGNLKGEIIFIGYTLVTGKESIVINTKIGPSIPFTEEDIIAITPGKKPIQLSLF